jgi:hypothetical protein
MRVTHLTIPEMALVAGTRAALGVGVGLLLADRLPYHERRAVGWTLLGVGVITTFPLVALFFGKSRPKRVHHKKSHHTTQMQNEPLRSSEFVGHA